MKLQASPGQGFLILERTALSFFLSDTHAVTVEGTFITLLTSLAHLTTDLVGG
jgi:hypothetical protein